MSEIPSDRQPGRERSNLLWMVLVFVLAAAIGAGAWSALNHRTSPGAAGASRSVRDLAEGSTGRSSTSDAVDAQDAGSSAPPTGAAGPLPIGNDIPNFSLTERSGRTVRREDLDGKVWIADFIFTRCPNICPDLTRKMSIIRKKLDAQGAGDVVSVSFSVDPVFDTPKILSAYADMFKADRGSWLFLTGDPQEMVHLVNGGFQLAMSDPMEGPPAHSNRFVLVDARGRVRATHLGSDPGVVATIYAEALRLRGEPRG